jgi:putative chitinase
MNITLDILQAVCPRTPKAKLDVYIDPLNESMEHYEINHTIERIAAFLAQTAHESGGYTAVSENLNYSSRGLMGTFKKYFPNEQLAKQYERNPEKIANRVYANRMGNGDEASGDGFKYRGRGLIQLTGKVNYTRYATSHGMTLEQAVEQLSTPQGAVESAAWFWDSNKLNAIVDRGDFVLLTKRINGGTIGLEDRRHHYEAALSALGA